MEVLAEFVSIQLGRIYCCFLGLVYVEWIVGCDQHVIAYNIYAMCTCINIYIKIEVIITIIPPQLSNLIHSNTFPIPNSHNPDRTIPQNHRIQVNPINRNNSINFRIEADNMHAFGFRFEAVHVHLSLHTQHHIATEEATTQHHLRVGIE